MTWKVSVIRGSVETDLSDGRVYLLTGFDGIGMPPTTRITQQGPQQHGVSDVGFRIQPRRLIVTLMAKGGDATTWFARRDELLRVFRPSDTPISIRITRDDGAVRQIDCHYSGQMELGVDPALGVRWQRVGIELFCPDPTWYDPVEQLTTVAGGGGTGFAVPTPVPSSVGASALVATVGIDNPGSWDTLPIIDIDGPVTNLAIENLTTGEKLGFTGVTITSGTTYRIDCRYGQKTVTRLSDGANRVQDLSSDSNLATFHLAAGVVNEVRVTGTGIQSNTAVRIRFTPRYLGV